MCQEKKKKKPAYKYLIQKKLVMSKYVRIEAAVRGYSNWAWTTVY